MDVYLGIDAGGTRTRAALVNDKGAVLGVGASGPGNPHNVGEPTAAKHLEEATRAAWADAGQKACPATHAFLGVAGTKTADDFARLRAAAEAKGLAPAGAVRVENDLHNALAGGLGGAPGIALIAGTGSNCLGRDASGATCMCGGWGWLMGDEGAGFGLAAEGLRRATRSADGRASRTRLLESALAYFGVSEPDALLTALYAGPWQPDRVAAFGPVVTRLAEEGDAGAGQVLRKGAAVLAGLVAATARQLEFPTGPNVVLLGGCLAPGGFYTAMVEAAIAKAAPSARLCKPLYPPLHGAVLNALRMSGGGKEIHLQDPAHRLAQAPPNGPPR
ncbi:MAG: ATPase [Opitutales bacterium]|nr:ATPase [Opitutales bacterium]